MDAQFKGSRRIDHYCSLCAKDMQRLLAGGDGAL